MRQDSGVPRALAVGLAVCALASEPAAQAQEDTRTPPEAVPPAADRVDDEFSLRHVRVGAIGGMGFPRPLAVEGMIMFGRTVALGAEYGVLPPVTIGGVRTSLWSLATDTRVFPFHGPFFIGLRAGRQHVDAATTITVGSVGSGPEVLALDSWFLNPRIGVLWTASNGIAFGFEVGVQIPVVASVASTLPLSLDPAVQRTADSLGRSVIPTVDILRVGAIL
jgi:hypothetical protein